MSIERTIWTWKKYRIVEIREEPGSLDMDELKGDCYKPDTNENVPAEKLREEEKEFERKVYEEGVWGYQLQRWVPTVGVGWDTLNSCFGFVGPYNKDDVQQMHYIVDEFIAQARNRSQRGE